MVVQWKDLGLTDPNAIECSNFFPACAFFFYIDELAKAHPEINNALHKAWLDKFKKPMSAEDLDTLPDTFNAEDKHWYKATIGYMQDKLTDVERGLRGLPLKPATQTEKRIARTKASVIERAKEREALARTVKPMPKRAAATTESDDDEILSSQPSKR